MNQDREEGYRNLRSKIGNTPLERFQGEVPNKNRIWIKRECDNPWGSHYDRVYFALYKHYEQLEKIVQGNRVFETTSGTAGVSFAGIGRKLGFECHVAIPEGVDNAVIEAIKREGATIYFTLEKDYIAGFPKFLREFEPWKKGFVFLNHSMGVRRGPAYTNNEVTLEALSEIGKEVVSEREISFYFPAVGNGSSIIGVARGLPNTKIITFESFQSAVMFDLLFPGEYKQRFGIEPGSLPKHHLRGTSFQGIDFPHIQEAVRERIILDAKLVSDKEVDENYFNATGRRYSEELPHWDRAIRSEFGRSTNAGLAVALEYARDIEGKDLLIIAYDKADRYDSWMPK